MSERITGQRQTPEDALARSMEDRRGAGSAWAMALRELGVVDRAVYQAVADTPTVQLDRHVRRLSNAANYSRLWLGMAAAIAVLGRRRGRRARGRARHRRNVSSRESRHQTHRPPATTGINTPVGPNKPGGGGGEPPVVPIDHVVTGLIAAVERGPPRRPHRGQFLHRVAVQMPARRQVPQSDPHAATHVLTAAGARRRQATPVASQ